MGRGVARKRAANGQSFRKEEQVVLLSPLACRSHARFLLRRFRGASCHGLWSFVYEDALKDLVNISQLALQVERALDLCPGNAAGNLLILQHQLLEIEAFPPSLHGIALHQTVGVLARMAVSVFVE